MAEGCRYDWIVFNRAIRFDMRKSSLRQHHGFRAVRVVILGIQDWSIMKGGDRMEFMVIFLLIVLIMGIVNMMND